MPSHVYLLASRPYGTLYLGVTSNLGRRIVEHKHKVYPGFSAKYGIDRLVWMEDYDRIVDAIAREKTINRWRRAWKVALIEEANPKWIDLFYRLNC